MDIYRSDHSIIHAVQVAGYRLLSGEIRNMSKDNIVVTSEYAIVNTVDGKIKAKLGDWILKLPDNRFVVLPHLVFKALYRKF